jgi:hypothetical protein
MSNIPIRNRNFNFVIFNHIVYINKSPVPSNKLLHFFKYHRYDKRRKIKKIGPIKEQIFRAKERSGLL